jgi:hypothetical protein
MILPAKLEGLCDLAYSPINLPFGLDSKQQNVECGRRSSKAQRTA